MNRQLSGAYHGEEITVSYAAVGQKTDFGVPGSPVWFEPTDPVVTDITILDVEVHLSDLPQKLQNTLLELSSEIEWQAELEEEDPL